MIARSQEKIVAVIEVENIVDEKDVAELAAKLVASFPPSKTKPVDFLGAQFDAGLAWVHFPVGYGGLGASPKHQKIVNEVIAASSGPSSYMRNPIGYGMCAPTIAQWGTPDQIQRYLRPLFTGEEIWCQLFSEPGSGSDFAGLSAKGVLDGEEWIVNGQKVWTTLAHLSRFGLLVVRTDPQAVKHAGLTALIVDMQAPGVEVRPLRQMTGEAEFNEVYFTDTRIPFKDTLGGAGDGWRVSLTTLMNERAAIGSGNSGDNNLLTRVIAMVKHYGLDTDPLIRVQLADIIMNYRIAAMNSQRTAASAKAGKLPGPEGSVGKMVLVNNQARLVKFVSHVLGPKLIADSGEWGTYAWNQLVLGTPGLRIAGGSDEVMRNIVGERVLGLPKDTGIDSKSSFRDLQK